MAKAGTTIYVGDQDLNEAEINAVVNFWNLELAYSIPKPNEKVLVTQQLRMVRRMCDVLNALPARHPGYWPIPNRDGNDYNLFRYLDDNEYVDSTIPPVSIDNITLPKYYAGVFVSVILNNVIFTKGQSGLTSDEYLRLRDKINAAQF